jgi:hypothetical protein
MGKHWPAVRKYADVTQVKHSPVVALKVPQVELTQIPLRRVVPEGQVFGTHCPFDKIKVLLRQERQFPEKFSNLSQAGLTL